MAQSQPVYFWRRNPFVRLVVPLIIGIIIQYLFLIPAVTLLFVSGIFVLLILGFTFLPLAYTYTYRWVLGLAINTQLIVLGALLLLHHDVRNTNSWVGYFTPKTMAIATILEPPVAKARTYKAEANVEACNINGTWIKTTGKILIYASKDGYKKFDYGSVILFNKPVQELKNAGNPGEFDYKEFNRYKNIFHQVFLKGEDYTVPGAFYGNSFQRWLFGVRKWVLNKLQQNIRGRYEAGVAEALLVGYRDDLDRDLVQAYRNTGVVHIIAISGLHLGLIYMVLVFLFAPFKKTKCIKWIKPLVILTVLWVFALLAGAVPSILRSAVMFSFIIIGEALQKKTSIYNTLASSAFILLCVNPYFLFDIGFQLSYTAVISIVIFFKPIYNLAYFKNKSLDFIWKLTAVTLSAQVLTIPIIFYAFHQFPILFVLTNVVVVPLATVVLFSEMVLLAFTIIPVAAQTMGMVTGSMLSFMNGFILKINQLPLALVEGIEYKLYETILLYLVIITIAYWLLNKAKATFFVALIAMYLLIAIGSYQHFLRRQQQKIIVYNIPKYKAIDFVAGKHFTFLGDDLLTVSSGVTQQLVKASRRVHGISPMANLPGYYATRPFIQFCGKKIVLIDSNYSFKSTTKMSVDLIILSHNPPVLIDEVARVFNCNQFVFDASNSLRKINEWKKDCDNLHLRHYSTSDRGAFVLNL